MPKTLPPPPGKCVHCLQDSVKRTWDHVFPKSWYPDTTPLQNSKWKIPSCLICNDKYGKIEEDLLLRLGLCLDPTKAATSGIANTVLRALNPNLAKGEKDERVRQKKRDKILKEIDDNIHLKNAVVLPGFDERWGQSYERHAKLSIPEKSIDLLTQKIARGIFYIRYGKFVEPPYVIEFAVVEQDKWVAISQVYKRHGFIYENGPGIVIYGAIAHDDPKSAGFSISIWGQFKVLAFVKISNLPNP